MKSCIAALALAALAAPAFATTTGSVTAGSFNVSLKDLDTADSVTPGLTWDNSWYFSGGSGYTPQLGYEAVLNSWGTSLNAVYGNYTSNWTSQNAPIRSHAGPTAQGTGAFSAQLDAQDRLTLSLQDSVSNGASSGASVQFSRGFWLTAGSQVSFSMLVNRELSGTAYAGSWVQPNNTVVSSYSASSAALSMNVGTANSSLSMYGSGQFSNPAAYDVVGEDDQLKLLVRNTTTTAQYYSLNIYASTYLQENLDPATAAMVPEPTSWALMAMGLMGVAGVARRRRA